MNAPSVSEIEALRVLVLENSWELLAEAELLYKHKMFARTYTLAHLSSEELAKLPILAWYGVKLANGQTIPWKELDKQLCNHKAKLKGLLFVDLLGKSIDPTDKNIQILGEKLSTVELFNKLKNTSLYAGVYQGDLYKPNAIISEACATQMLTAARNRLELYSAVEALTHGRIKELSNRPTYMKLLHKLGIDEAS